MSPDVQHALENRNAMEKSSPIPIIEIPDMTIQLPKNIAYWSACIAVVVLGWAVMLHGEWFHTYAHGIWNAIQF